MSRTSGTTGKTANKAPKISIALPLMGGGAILFTFPYLTFRQNYARVRLSVREIR